jgi:hypothetical protein
MAEGVRTGKTLTIPEVRAFGRAAKGRLQIAYLEPGETLIRVGAPLDEIRIIQGTPTSSWLYARPIFFTEGGHGAFRLFHAREFREGCDTFQIVIITDSDEVLAVEQLTEEEAVDKDRFRDWWRWVEAHPREYAEAANANLIEATRGVLWTEGNWARAASGEPDPPVPVLDVPKGTIPRDGAWLCDPEVFDRTRDGRFRHMVIRDGGGMLLVDTGYRSSSGYALGVRVDTREEKVILPMISILACGAYRWLPYQYEADIDYLMDYIPALRELEERLRRDYGDTKTVTDDSLVSNVSF